MFKRKMSKYFTLVPQTSFMLSLGVSIVLLQATFAQSFLLALSEQHTNYIDIDRLVGKVSNNELLNTTQAQTQKVNNRTDHSQVPTFLDTYDNNSTLFVYETTITGKTRTDLSQTTMDVVTIVWYVATFLALAAFFLLMACSDRRCNDSQRNAQATANTTETASAPPPLTPTPSYSEFAPPTYEAVMKMKEDARQSGIYVVPLPMEDGVGYKNDGSIIGNDEVMSAVLDVGALPVVDFYTIDEVHKIES